jgi:predicted phosphoribosyltransferase
MQHYPPVFENRHEAGIALAEALRAEEVTGGIAVGLARGGVEVAAPVARALGLHLDALAVRKVGHPWHPEYALGAVTPDGTVYLRESDGLDQDAIDAVIAGAQARARLLDERLHAEHPAHDPAGVTCILIDDGLATGATMIAAARWARRANASRVLAAVPVASIEGIAMLEREVDRVVCPVAVHDFGAVSIWYRSFGQVEDDRVIELLESAASPT